MEEFSSKAKTTLKYKLLMLGILLVCTLCVLLLRLQPVSKQNETLIALLSVAFALLFSVFSFFAGKQISTVLPHGRASVTFGASITGFLLVTVLIASVYFLYFTDPNERVYDMNGTVSLLMKLFGIASAVCFLMTAASTRLPEKKALHLFLNMMPALFFAFRILNDFINNTAMPLAKGGGYHLIGMIFMMLFFLCEGKMLIGNAKPFLYIGTGMIGVFLTVIYEIPAMVRVFENNEPKLYLLYSLLGLAFCIYVLTRLTSVQPLIAFKPVEEEAPAENNA